MANAENSLNSLVLSAYELKEINGWDDVMVEDYLTIIRNLSELAEIIDANAVEIIERLDSLEQLSPSLKRSLGRVLALSQKSKLNSEKAIQSNALNKRLSLKSNSKADLAISQMNNYVPQKGVMLAISGENTADPTIIDSYNVSTLVRNAVGEYRLTMEQSTMSGKDVFDDSIHSVNFYIVASANTEVFNVKLEKSSAGVFDIDVFEVTQGVGGALALTAYDLKSTDRLSISMDLTIGSYLPQE